MCDAVLFSSDPKLIYIGDDNPLTLEVTAENGGEGAYEADLIVTLPSQADFIGVVRNSEVGGCIIKLGVNVPVQYKCSCFTICWMLLCTTKHSFDYSFSLYR